MAWRHPDGTCGQFYTLFDILIGRFDYFYVMEPDALPIRPNWLERLVLEVQVHPCSDFWVKGSVAMCSGKYGNGRSTGDLHINGGALYCVPRSPDDGVATFMKRVQRFFPSGLDPTMTYPGCMCVPRDALEITQFQGH